MVEADEEEAAAEEDAAGTTEDVAKDVMTDVVKKSTDAVVLEAEAVARLAGEQRKHLERLGRLRRTRRAR